MMPHARLHPSAPTKSSRTSSRPAPATLNEQVKVRTMMSANRISEILSIGSSMRVGRFVRGSNLFVKRLLLLPAAPQRVKELHQCQAFIELSLCQAQLGIEVTGIDVKDFQITCHSAFVAHICESNGILRGIG